MDIVDRDLSRAERDASPERFPDSFPAQTPKHLEQTLAPNVKDTQIERRDTATSLGSTASSSSSSSVVREAIGMSRVNTQRDLERHPTELDRIETHRTQHGSTVGRTLTSRKSKKPLPNFGGGKECKALPLLHISFPFTSYIGIAGKGLTLKHARPTSTASAGRIC